MILQLGGKFIDSVIEHQDLLQKYQFWISIINAEQLNLLKQFLEVALSSVNVIYLPYQELIPHIPEIKTMLEDLGAKWKVTRSTRNLEFLKKEFRPDEGDAIDILYHHQLPGESHGYEIEHMDSKDL